MRRGLLLLCAIVLAAAVLRGIGLGGGSPELQPDEPIMVEGAGALLEGMRPDVVLGWPGSPQLILLSSVFAADLAVRRGTGLIRDPGGPGAVLDRHYAEFYRTPHRWYLLFRLVSVLLGLGTLVIVFAIGRKLDGAGAGLLAAAFLAFASLHVRYSQLVLPDVPTAFLSALAFLVLLGGSGPPSLRRVAGAAFVAGLAAATKFNAGIFLVFLAGVALFARETRARDRVRAVAAVAAAGLAGLLIGCPWLVTDLPLVLKDFLWRNVYQQVMVGRAGAGGPDSGFGNLGLGLVTLRFGVVPAALLLPGLAAALLRRRRADLLLAAATLFYLLVLGFSRNLNARWLLPVLPLLCVLGGTAAAWAWRTPFLRPVPRRAAIAVLAAAILFPAGVRSLRLVLGNREPTSRAVLVAWAREHLDPGDTIAVGFYAENPFPLCRAALRERVRDLARVVGHPERERPDTPVFLLPALLNEETFALQKARHLLAGATDEGFRVLEYGTADRYAALERDARAGRARAVVLLARRSYRTDRDPGEARLAKDREALLDYLHSAAVGVRRIRDAYVVYLLH